MAWSTDERRYSPLQHLVSPNEDSWRIILAYLLLVAVLAFLGGTAMGYAYGYQDGSHGGTEVPSGTEREEGP